MNCFFILEDVLVIVDAPLLLFEGAEYVAPVAVVHEVELAIAIGTLLERQEQLWEGLPHLLGWQPTFMRWGLLVVIPDSICIVR